MVQGFQGVVGRGLSGVQSMPNLKTWPQNWGTKMHLYQGLVIPYSITLSTPRRFSFKVCTKNSPSYRATNEWDPRRLSPWGRALNSHRWILFSRWSGSLRDSLCKIYMFVLCRPGIFKLELPQIFSWFFQERQIWISTAQRTTLIRFLGNSFFSVHDIFLGNIRKYRNRASQI